MKQKKWILALVLLLAVALLLPACGEKDKGEDEEFDYLKADLTQYITLGEYKGFSFSYEVEKITEADVEEYIAYILQDSGEYVDYENVTEDQVTVKNDYITIDFIGYMDGKTSSNTTGVDAKVLLDKENSGYIPGFIDDLFGVTVGTTVETKCVFPEDYGHEDYAGKEITFYIKVKSIISHYYPTTLTDELVAENTEFKTVEEYRAYLLEALKQSAKEMASENVYNDIWTELEKNVTVIKYPEAPVQDYFDSYMETIKSYAVQAGYEDYTLFMETELQLTEDEVMVDAKQAVLDDMIIFAIIQAEDITATDEEYDFFVSDIAEANSVTVEEIEAEYGEDYLMECVLYNKAIDLVYDSSNIQYVEK